MSHQFKVGDLALIIGSITPGSPNVGKSVELIGLYSPGDALIAPDGTPATYSGDQPAWLCEGRGLMAKGMNDDWVDHGGITFAGERFLMPLLGDFAPERQKSQEVPA